MNNNKIISVPKLPGHPYSLHDVYISSFEVVDDALIIHFYKGFYTLPDEDGDDNLQNQHRPEA